jgi:hypothetical protein
MLLSAVALGPDFNAAIEALRQLPWDSPELVVLGRKEILSVLQRCQGGQLSPEQVEEWANALEGRDDLGFEPADAELLHEVIFELANPVLTNQLSASRLLQLIMRLGPHR